MSVIADFVDGDEETLAQLLGPEVPCPRCRRTLRRDPLWSRPYFIDDASHTYSNIRVLVEELREQGWLPARVRRAS